MVLRARIAPMTKFDAKHTAASFQHIANEAERYMLEAKSKISRTLSYRGLHDDHLAKFYVYNYLAVRCESREHVLDVLTRLLTEPHAAPSSAFDATRFKSAYQGCVRAEIQRLSACS